MKKHLLLATTAATLFCLQQTTAQNTSPYWSLAGNSNASNTTSKLGTTNAINLRLFTNNAERLRILSSNGNVGIGTITPTDRLHLNTPVGTNALRVQVNAATKLLVASNGGVAVGANKTPPVNGLFVNGNVTVGTTNETFGYKMHVLGGGIKVSQYTETGDDNLSYGVYAEGATGVHGSGMTGVSGDGMTGVEGTGYWGVHGSGSIGVQGYSEDGQGGVFGSNSGTGLEASTTSGTYAGAFYGAVYLSSGYTTSDKNLKQNVQEFEGALSIIGKLKPRLYEFKTESKYASLHLPKGKQYGLLAQDVEEVLPDLVSTADHKLRQPIKPDANGKLPKPNQQTAGREQGEKVSLKAVNYTELIPILIKGMQEQAELIQQQQAQINDLKAQINRLSGGSTNVLTGTSLGLNAPNPAKGATRISYAVPANSRAHLLLTDNLGKTIKTISLNGSGVVNLNTAALSSGMYHYSLVVDGKIVESRKMEVIR